MNMCSATTQKGKPSRYNFLYCSGSDHALWNTRTGAFDRISAEAYALLCSGQLSALDASALERFTAMGAIIPEDMDEPAMVVDRQRCGCEHAPLYFRILTTTACNAHCPYCYEKGFPLQTMDAECARSTAAFILRRYEEQSLPVTLEWYGGEPLMNPRAISLICEALQAADVPFVSNLTTNGLLLTPALMEVLVHVWRTHAVQITIEAVHAAYAREKGVPRDSFRRLLASMEQLLQSGVRVKVRINDSGGGSAPKKVIRCLYRRFGTHRNLKIYLSPMYLREQMPSAARMRRILHFEQELFRLGYADAARYYRFPPCRSRCFACTAGGYTIAPDGGLFNCSHVLDAAHRLGTVFEPDAALPGRQRYTNAPLSEGCRACVCLPICGGGCRTGELGEADMFQCFPYRSVLPEIMAIRLKQKT